MNSSTSRIFSRLHFVFLAAIALLVSPGRAADPAVPAATELQYRKDGGGYLLVLKPGQKVIESLIAFMDKEKLPGASITAIGAVKNADIAYYDIATKQYKRHIFESSCEVVSLSGSLGYFNDKPVVHAHVALAGPDYLVHGGHVFEAEVSLVLEVFITPTTQRIVRQLNSEFPSLRTINLDGK